MSDGVRTGLLFAALLFSVVVFADGPPAHDSPHRAHGREGGGLTTKGHDVCALLAGEEVEAVLGEPVKERRSSAQPHDGLLTSQCVFIMATPARSVSVAVAAPDAARPSGLNPREYWRRQFHPSSRADADRREAESERESHQGRAIDGLGEEAYWVGTPIAGAVYVLAGDLFLRVSVGGMKTESARIEKSTALARAILERL
jgi:hypothetical protein